MVDDLHVPAVFCNSVLIYVLLWIVCRKGVLDPKTLANRDTGYLSQAIQILVAGHRKSIPISQQYRRNSEQCRRIQKKFRQNLDLFRQNLDVLDRV